MTVAIVGVGEVEPAWHHDRPVIGLAVDAARRALADAGLSAADVDGFATEAETMHGARADEVGFATRCPRPSVQRPVVHRRGRRHQRHSARRAGHRSRLGRRRRQLLRHQPQHPGRRTVQRARRRPGQGRPRDAVRLLRPTRLLRGTGAALCPRVRADRRTARHRCRSRRGPSRSAHPERSRRNRSTSTATSPIASSPDPLRRLDCCLINDAAAAFVMTSAERARDLRRPPVLVAGTGFGTKPVTEASYFTQNPQYLEMASVSRAGGPSPRRG